MSAVLAVVVGAAAWAAAIQAPLYAMAQNTTATAPALLSTGSTLSPVEHAPAAVTGVETITVRSTSRPTVTSHVSFDKVAPAPQTPPRETPFINSGEPVTLDFTNADLRAVLRTFGDISGLNVVLDPKVEGRVNLSLKQVPWDQALDTILRSNGLGYEMDGTSIHIAPPSVLAAARLAQTAQPPGAPGQMRRLIKVAYADYPPEALDKQISGTVKATIVVNAAGDVTMADVTSGPAELRASAFKASMGLKYSPGTDTVRIDIALEYRLDPQGWGVRVIQDSGTVSITPATAGALPPTPPGPFASAETSSLRKKSRTCRPSILRWRLKPGSRAS